MKKKLVLGLLVFVALFTITGCGSKKEESKESNNSKSSTSDIASVVTCRQKNEGLDAVEYDFIMVANFDKDDVLIDVKDTRTYGKESDAQNEYKSRKATADAGYIKSLTIDKNVVTTIYTKENASSNSIKTEKDKFIRQYKNAGWTCE